MALFRCVPPCGHTSPGPATIINPALMLFRANAHLYVGDVGVRESKEIQGKFRIRLRQAYTAFLCIKGRLFRGFPIYINPCG
jgi:hypothetical protein